MWKAVVAVCFMMIQTMYIQFTDIPVLTEKSEQQQIIIMAPELQNEIMSDLRPMIYKRQTFPKRTNIKIDEEPNIEEKYIIDVTEEEVFYLEALICAEIGDLPEEEQIATAATIINRVQSSNSDFSKLNTLTDVIFQKNQYSTVKDGKIYKRETEVTPEMIKEVTKNAVQRALKGEDPTEELLKEKAYSLGLDVEKYVENGATFFYSPRWSSTQAMAARANIKVKVQYGEHIYYTYWDR